MAMSTEAEMAVNNNKRLLCAFSDILASTKMQMRDPRVSLFTHGFDGKQGWNET